MRFRCSSLYGESLESRRYLAGDFDQSTDVAEPEVMTVARADARLLSQASPASELLVGDNVVHVYHPQDNNAPSGAIRNIKFGLSQLGPGDTLVVHEGTYAESFRGLDIPGGVSWAKPVTLLAQGRVVIKPDPGADRVITLSEPNSHYIIIDGFILDATNVQFDAVKITESTSSPAHSIWIRNTEIKNSPRNGILVTAGAESNRFTNLNVHSNGRTAFHHGLYIASSNNLIEASRVHHNLGWGIHVFTVEQQLANNAVIDNVAYQNGQSGRGDGIGLYNIRGFQVRGNVVFANSTSGISYGYNTSAGVISANLIYDHPDGEIFLTRPSDDSGTETLGNVILGDKWVPDSFPWPDGAKPVSAFLREGNAEQAVVFQAPDLNTTNQVSVTLYVTDPELPDEGSLDINGRGTVPLFGDSTNPDHNGQEARLTFDTPGEWWNAGENLLTFRRFHSAFHVLAIEVVGTETPHSVEDTSPTVITPGVLPIDVSPRSPAHTILVDVPIAQVGTTAFLTLRVWDAELANEGSLDINDRGRIELFGESNPDLDRLQTSVVFETPSDWWNEGANSLTFTHQGAGDFDVLEVDVAFASAPTTEVETTAGRRTRRR